MDVWAAKAALWAEHGRPTAVDVDVAVRLAGLRIEDTFALRAFRYRSAAAAEAFAAADLEYYGHPTLVTFPVDGGILSILDLRPALAAATRGG